MAHRFNIARKVRAHNKKIRKEARKNPDNKSRFVEKMTILIFTFVFVEKKPKDIKIPKLAPFKEELLQQAVVAKQNVRFCLNHSEINEEN